jgi:hypothetical protein
MSVRLLLHLGELTIVGLFLFACGTGPAPDEPVPTPNLVATEVAVQKAAAATLTAEAILAQAQVTEELSATEETTPTETPLPLPTASPVVGAPTTGDTIVLPDTATPIPPTPTATPTPLPTATSIPPTPTEPAPPTPTPPLLVDVPVEGGQSELEGKIFIPGFTRDQLQGPNNDVTFRDRLVFRVEAYDPGKGKYDGAGIKEVKIRIFGPNSHEPDNPNHERTERTAGYCVFGGGEPDCNVFNFKDNHRWPETGHDIVNGHHAVRIVITTEDGWRETWNWSFEIDK